MTREATIIKEYSTYAKRYVLRDGQYGSDFTFFLKLIAEARKDFPDLKDGDVKIVQFGGRFYKYTFGIEFEHDGDIPETYRQADFCIHCESAR